MRTGLVTLIVILLLSAGCTTPTDHPPTAPGEARMIVTTDMGTDILIDETLPVSHDTTVLSLLQETAEVETAHDGGFVRSINGKTSGQPNEKTDWFYHINGRLGSSGSADHPVTHGDVVVWDHRPWNHTMTLPFLLNGLGEWPVTTGIHDPPDLAEKTDSPHIFLRVQDDELQILDAWRRTALTLPPPWLVAHVIDEDGSPRLLLGASDPNATSLTTALDDHPPAGLGIVITPDAHHPIPAPEP